MPTDADVEYTIKTLSNVAKHQQSKLRRAAALRQTLAEALDRGERPDHYRLDWIIASMKRVNMLMLEICDDFNTAYPDDRCSVADLVDILLTTVQAYRSRA